MVLFFIRAILIFGALCLIGCSTGHLAPVSEKRQPTFYRAQNQYYVQKGDTLHKIAWRCGKNYHTLARLNRLSDPNRIYPGQILKLSGQTTLNKTIIQNQKKTVKKNLKPASKTLFYWPAKGKIVSHYIPGKTKGIQISGKYQSPIQAAAEGEVVYQGNALKGYGNLVILKHQNGFLTAYAHNDTILVSEGMKVKKGQRIATMGKKTGKNVLLHFEIRHHGKPIDPMQLLG